MNARTGDDPRRVSWLVWSQALQILQLIYWVSIFLMSPHYNLILLLTIYVYKVLLEDWPTIRWWVWRLAKAAVGLQRYGEGSLAL